MKIIPTKENTEGLIRLWSDVFGDEREYIELLFPRDKSICDVFATFDGGKIISALYLLDCVLTFNGVPYTGKYLYAAATDESHRSKGIMSTLIKEACEFCIESGFDFISLVPANEGLYKYYAKFGFIDAMHRKIIHSRTNEHFLNRKEITGVEYFLKRKDLLDNCISFSGKSEEYAISCLEYSGVRFYESQNDVFYISADSACVFDELIKENAASYCIFNEDISEVKVNCEKYGMLFPIHTELKKDWNFTDIYMNIALD